MTLTVEVVKQGKKGLMHPQVGDFCRINYDCYLLTDAKSGGRKVDSSRDKGKPFEFPVGIGACIPAFDDVVMRMTVGERVTFICPPNMGCKLERAECDLDSATACALH